jgi:GT2 family glycosyltransferase
VTRALSVAVVVCAYTNDRWDDLLAAYRSLTLQTVAPDEVIMVIDHNEPLRMRLQLELPEARVIANTGQRGLSGGRNTGVNATAADLILFLDDDARADSRWVESMTEPFSDPQVFGTGGWATPNWDGGVAPRWFPEPFLWVVGCSYPGLPETVTDIRNPLGCAMAFRKSVWPVAGGFSESMGRIGTHPVGCEETEFCIRLQQAEPTARILMQPAAVVHHRVRANRQTLRYFSSRCYWEGVSKAAVASSVGKSQALASERTYVQKVLPASLLRGVGQALRGDVGGLLRSAAITIGLSAAVLGFARGKLAGGVVRRHSASPVPRVDVTSVPDAAPPVNVVAPIEAEQVGAA